MSYVEPKFAAEYVSPREREVEETRRKIAWNERRAHDPTRLSADRARSNELANAARVRLRALLAPKTTKETDTDA